MVAVISVVTMVVLISVKAINGSDNRIDCVCDGSSDIGWEGCVGCGGGVSTVTSIVGVVSVSKTAVAVVVGKATNHNNYHFWTCGFWGSGRGRWRWRLSTCGRNGSSTTTSRLFACFCVCI